MAATASVAVARLGGQAKFWGRGGEDAAGHAMRRELALEDVDCSQFRLFKGAKSSVSGVLVDPSGERTILNFRGDGLPTDPSWLPIGRIAEAGSVLADPRWPEGAAYAFAAARDAGVPTVLDADVAETDVLDMLLPLTDHAIFSKQALEAYAGSDGLEKATRKGCTVVAVTRGSDGMQWIENGIAKHTPAFAVAVVDTTGAGDVFHGAWAFAIAAGATTDDAAVFASAAAALKCTRPTGRVGIPTLSETLNLWRQDV